MLRGNIDNSKVRNMIIDGNIFFNDDVPDYDYIKRLETIFMKYTIIIFITPEYFDSFIRNADSANLFYDSYMIMDYDSIIEYSIKTGIPIATDGVNLLKFSGRGILLSDIRGLR